ncbi:MAG: cell division protein, partial [Bifidobacterium sp.]|nr:cell division protein [Bifidobacterium sp.]
LNDARRQASEITDKAKSEAQQIVDDSKVTSAETMAKVNAEAEQVRSDIAAQQEDATKKVGELLKSLEERRVKTEKETQELIEQAKATRKDADSFASFKREESERKASQLLEEAKQRAQAEVEAQRKAAQAELDGLKDHITKLQHREATITSRVDELRNIFSKSFGNFDGFHDETVVNDQDEGQAPSVPVVNAVPAADPLPAPATKAESEDDGVGQPLADPQEEAPQASDDSVAASQPADGLVADDVAADSAGNSEDETSAAVTVRSSANMPTQVLPSPAPSVLPDASDQTGDAPAQAKGVQVEKAVTDQETTVIPPVNDGVTSTDRD